MPKSNLILADKFASDYDNSILKNDWNGVKVIYNAINTIIKPQSNILDLGIGTGESSIRFQNDGHNIVGLDGSSKMLEECKKKNIASKLHLHNIEEFPFPLKESQFDTVISNGVFHLVYPLKPVFTEVRRILKADGLFAFTYENTDNIIESAEITPGIYERETESGVRTYKYANKLISDFLAANNFEKIKEKRFLAFTNKQIQKSIYFNAVVAKLK
jgi:predicted TPR repeat methyltransferase